MSHPKVSPHRAFTLVELLVLVVVAAVLVGLLVPAPSRSKNRSKRIQCVNNLKNIGLAFRVHPLMEIGAGYPFQIPVERGGTKELGEDPSQTWRHWAVVSNQLASPRILICPSDRQRVGAASFSPAANVPTQFVFRGNHQLSYFLGLLASEERPQSILAGDRNLTTNGVALQPGRHDLAASTKLGWTETIHRSSGNVLLGDGSVQQTTSGRLNDQLQDAQRFTGATNDIWLIP